MFNKDERPKRIVQGMEVHRVAKVSKYGCGFMRSIGVREWLPKQHNPVLLPLPAGSHEPGRRSQLLLLSLQVYFDLVVVVREKCLNLKTYRDRA